MPKFSVGQKVQCVDQGTGYQLCVGQVYEITLVDGYNERLYLKDKYGNKLASSFGFERFILVNEDTVAPKHKLLDRDPKVGDKVVVVTFLDASQLIGAVGTVAHTDSSHIQCNDWSKPSYQGYTKWYAPRSSVRVIDNSTKTLSAVEVGDTLVAPNGGYRIVHAVTGNIVFFQGMFKDDIQGGTFDNLTSLGWKVKPDTVELTKKEIAEKFGITEEQLVVK